MQPKSVWCCHVVSSWGLVQTTEFYLCVKTKFWAWLALLCQKTPSCLGGSSIKGNYVFVKITLPSAKCTLSKVPVRLLTEVLAKVILNACFFWQEEIPVRIMVNLSERDPWDLFFSCFTTQGILIFTCFSEPSFVTTLCTFNSESY